MGVKNKLILLMQKYINPALLFYLFFSLQQCTSPGNQQEIIWPGDSWATSTPEAEGLDAAVLDSIHADITNGKYGLIDEFLVIRHGKVVASHQYKQNYDSIATHYDTTNHMFNYDHPAWHPYYQRTNLHSLQSVTKSINSIALGIAMDEGHLGGVDIHPMELFTDYEQDFTDPRRKAITLEDLLTMRSGIDWSEAGSYESDENSCIIMERSDAWVQYVLSRPMREDPGTKWDYNSGVSVLLGKLVSLSTGMRVDK
jgi:CubicO group peptidase (beta-lactamase class C family)